LNEQDQDGGVEHLPTPATGPVPTPANGPAPTPTKAKIKIKTKTKTPPPPPAPSEEQTARLRSALDATSDGVVRVKREPWADAKPTSKARPASDPDAVEALRAAQAAMASAEQLGADAIDYDDLATFRIDPSKVGSLAGKKVLTTIKVGKPDRQTFFRMRPDPANDENFAVIELKEDNEFYLLDGGLYAEWASEVRLCSFRVGITLQGVLFLAPVVSQTDDGRRNHWNQSKREAYRRAETTWVRMVANRGAGYYDVFEAAEQHADPAWPEGTFHELLRLGFKDDGFIRNGDHPVLKRLRTSRRLTRRDCPGSTPRCGMRFGCQGHAKDDHRQTQCRRHGRLGRPEGAGAAGRLGAGDFSARSANPRGARCLSKGGDREMVADHQGGQYQGGIIRWIAQLSAIERTRYRGSALRAGPEPVAPTE
jgi:hypothetical protein